MARTRTQVPEGVPTTEQISEMDFQYMDTEVTVSLRDRKSLTGDWMRSGYVYGSEDDPTLVLDISGRAVAVPFRLIRSIRPAIY